MCKVYDRRVSLALIPFYMERLEYLKEEIRTQEASDKNTTKDLTFLRNMQTNIERDLDFERNELRESAQKIYDKWLEIKDLRTNNKGIKYTQTKLKVHQGEDGQDILFNIINDPSFGELAGEVLSHKQRI